MEINVKHGDELVFSLTGRLDTTTSVELRDAFEKEDIKEDLVIMEMKDLEYISSAGLRTLLYIKKVLVEKNKKLEIHNLNNICLEVFKVTGFINVLTVK